MAMRGMRRAANVAMAAVALLIGSALGTAVGAAPPAGAVSVVQALAGPHIYAGGGVLGFGAPQVGAPITGPLNSVCLLYTSPSPRD